MITKDEIRISDFTRYSKEKLSKICIDCEASSEALIEGVGAIGTLLFEVSCADNDEKTKDTLGKIGLLIQEVITVAQALNDNAFYSNEEIKRRREQDKQQDLISTQEKMLHYTRELKRKLNPALSKLSSSYPKDVGEIYGLLDEISLMASATKIQILTSK